MARMPGARWVGERSPRTRMARYDVVCLHTIVGYAPAHAAHFSVRANGEILQSRDTMYRSGANLDGNHRVIAIENEDHGAAFGSWNVNDGHAVPDFTAAQVEANAQILAWAHKTHGIPLQLCPNSRPTSRGLAFHRQGIDGNWSGYQFSGRVSGGEVWTSARGKVCPGDRRIARRQQILDRAIEIVRGTTPKPPDPPKQEDDMPYRDWPAADKKALADDLATAILSRKNSTSGRNIMFHTRRGDNATAHFTSLVSGNDVSLATAARHAQQKSTEARNVLVPRITSPISGNDIALRSMWSYQYRDINRARDENKSAFKAVQGEIAQVKATLAAQGALLKQVLERPGQPIDMKAIESAALAGAQEALRELDVRIEIAAADEPEIPDPVVDVITDGSDEPQLDEDDA